MTLRMASETPLPRSQSDASRPLPRPFEVRVVETSGTLLVRVSGPLDGEFAPELRRQLLPCCRSGERVVVDLLRTDYLDSEGVRALLALYKALHEVGGELHLVAHPGSRPLRTLTLLRLEQRIPIHETIRQALRSGS